MRNHSLVAMILFLGGVAWLAFSSSGAPLSPLYAQTDKQPIGWLGVQSCAATACHGNSDTSGDYRSAYLTWMEADPHRHAYQTLTTAASKRMVELYRGNPSARAESDALCLKCHATPQAVSQERIPNPHSADGVSCESCHGPAGGWVVPHLRANWRTKTPAAKEALGFVPLSDLSVRAERCIACHVGAPGQEVDHDLLAAGHPPLFFEFSSHLARLPKHWNAERERASKPDLDARAWRVGQAATASACLNLLAHRAANETAVWPELAGFDCVSCHRDLGPAAGAANRSARQIQWGFWAFPPAFSAEVDPYVMNQLTSLRAIVNTLSPELSPDARANIASQASEMATHFRKVAVRCAGTAEGPEQVRQRLRSWAQLAAEPEQLDWSSQVQILAAVAAHARTLADLERTEISAAAQEVYGRAARSVSFYRHARPADAMLIQSAVRQLVPQFGAPDDEEK